MARQGQLITASFPKQSCGSSALVARGAKGSPPRTGHKMGTQNQAIDKSKDEMATKRLVVLPRGERPRCCANRNVAGSFNSRSREGSDCAGDGQRWQDCGFNSRSRVRSDFQGRWCPKMYAASNKSVVDIEKSDGKCFEVIGYLLGETAGFTYRAAYPLVQTAVIPFNADGILDFLPNHNLHDTPTKSQIC